MEQIKKVVSTKTTIKSISLFTNSFGFAQPMLKFTSPVNDKVNRQKFDTVFVPEIKILNKFTHSKGSIIDLQISPEIAFTGYVKKGDLLNHIGTKCKCGATYIVVGDSLFCSGAICPYKSTTNLIRFLIFTSAHILSDGDKLSSDDVTHYIRAFIPVTSEAKTIAVNNLHQYLMLMKPMVCDIAPRRDVIFNIHKDKGESFCQRIHNFEVQFQNFMNSDRKFIVLTPDVFWPMLKFPYIKDSDNMELCKVFKTLTPFVDRKKVKILLSGIKQLTSSKTRKVIENNLGYIQSLIVEVLNYGDKTSADKATTKN